MGRDHWCGNLAGSDTTRVEGIVGGRTRFFFGDIEPILQTGAWWLRYLNNKQYDVTYESVTEREFLLKQAPGLVDRAEFAYVANEDDKTPGWKFGLEF